jgi:phosphoserine phosphatase RsbU/P
MALANAGNPDPYRNGEEMAVQPGLPLGVLEAATYDETRYQIATSSTGELYGFDRTQAISNQPAHTIVEAVKQFGQEDDITVLTLTLVEAAHA